MKAYRKNSGFTLVEILIVVVILGILAAIVIPQFSDASTEARVSSLRGDLQTMRSQIQLYKIQHNDYLPGAGTATFTQALIGYTDVAGAVWVSGTSTGTMFGPYLQAIPTNPFTTTSTITEGTGSAGNDTTAWYFNTSTGAFNADDTGTEGGTDHSTL